MTFSSKVKLEVINNYENQEECESIEIVALVNNCGFIYSKFDVEHIYIQTDNIFLAKKYFTLLKETFNIRGEISVKTNIKFKKSYYFVKVSAKKDTEEMLKLVSFLQSNAFFCRKAEKNSSRLTKASNCNKKRYLGISFLLNGSLSDPTKNYHLEFIYSDLNNAKVISYILNSYNLNAKIIERKNYFIVYIKESENISDFLNIIGAHTNLMYFENVRILKDVSNNINRKVNCETANISKTINAAVKQQEDIKFITETKGYNYLPYQLQEIANLRLLNPDATLKEIGEMLMPSISKSGVNHRLRKISNIAKSLRGDK